MDNKKHVSKAGLVTTVIVVLLAAAAVIATLYLRNAPSDTRKEQQYLNQAVASVNTTVPLMQSDISNIFYTMAADGTVTFYEYDGQALNQIEPTGTVDVAPHCSGLQIPATIYYVQRGEEITGYGLYNPPATGSSVYMYTYFFFNMRTLPDGFPANDNTQFLLLMDSDADDLYVQNKTYDESFFIQPFEEDIELRTDPERNQFVSQLNRMSGMDGRYWSDFAVFTDDVLAGAFNGNTLFFSGRQYTDQQESHQDIYRRNGNRSNVRRTAYRDVAYMYAFEDTNGGIHYMKQTDGGFAVYCNDDVVKEFTGDYNTGYLRDGNYLLDKSRATVIDLLTGTERALTGADTSNAVLFRMNPTGEKCIIGTMQGESTEAQSIILADLTAGTSAAVSGANLFSATNAELDFIDADAYFHNTGSDTAYTGRVFSFDSVFAQLSEENSKSEAGA